MNEEMLKTTLLEIIKEAENLPESELEVIPGTRIPVKKGRVDEFKANARFYYGLKNNVIVNNDDYIKEVYYELSDELARDEGEHVLSKAYELYSMNKDELERFNALNKSLAINGEDKEKYRKMLEDLNRRNVADPKTWEEITNLQNSLKTLAENEIIIKNAIAEIKDKVNNEIKKAVEEEMNFLRESYLNMKSGTSIGFGLDGASILAKDKENYDNLYILLKIIENVNEKDPIIFVDNTLCVNPHQIDAVKELLPKINFLSLVKKEEKKEAPKKEKPNDKIIASISKELERLREKIKRENLPSDQIEYDNLIKILQILNRANNTEFALTQVWNTFYVNGIDREPLINILRNTEYFKGYNPDIEKVKENEILIDKLKGYLTSLEDKVRNYQGEMNIPLVQVANAVVLPEDKQEYENVLAIINILQNTKENLMSISEGGNISSNDYAKYKELLSNTRYFTPNIMAQKIEEQNGPLIKEVEQELTDLIKKAKATPNAILAPGKEILASDLEEYNLLSRKYAILKNVNPNGALIEVNGALINTDQKEEYQEVMDNLAKLHQKDEEKLDPAVIETVRKEIERASQRLTHLQVKAGQALNAPLIDVKGEKILAEDLEEYEAITTQLNILAEVANTKAKDLVEVNGTFVPVARAQEYQDAINKLAFIDQKKEKPSGPKANPLDSSHVKEVNDILINKANDKINDLLEVAKKAKEKKLAENVPVLVKDLEEYEALNKQIDILKEAETLDVKDVVEVNGAYVPAKRVQEYQEIINQLQKKEATPKNKIRKAVKNIRKCKSEAKTWWKKNWKKVALVGLSAVAIVATLSTLAPTIIYANSCLAMANPALSGVLGGINSTIINTLGLTLGELNLNVAASQAFTALITALGKIGIVGLGTVGVVKGLKGIVREDENRLPDPNRKTVAKRILDLGEQLIDKSKELSKTLATKASEFTENLAYATNANNMKLESEVLNAKMGFDPDIKNAEPLDDNFDEIEDNVQNQIEEEKRKVIEDRINERFNRIKHAEDAEYIRPTTLSDEPVIKGPASEPSAPVTVTIPTDDEILSTISDKSLQIARVDNYIDALKAGDTMKASEYQKLVFDETGIDLSKYNMDNYEELVEARSDVANFMNQIHTTKRSR